MGAYNTSLMSKGMVVGHCMNCMNGLMILRKDEGVVVCNFCFAQIDIDEDNYV
jgi:hypothetical protein